MLDHLTYSFAKDKYSATPRDKFNSVVLSVRENLVEQWMKTQQQYYYMDIKRIYYLSLEFLLGRLLRNYIINLDLLDDYRKAVDVLGMTYEEIFEHEWDAGLGDGGLGRLASCFLDSMATLQYPGYGYGIRYEYGIFSQKIKNGYQMEAPDNWLRYGNPWEFPRPELIYPVHFYGRVNTITGESGKFRMEWVDTDEVMAMAYDYPVPGFHNDTVNTLRLWSAKSSRGFRLEYFYSGDYIKAVEDKSNSETISKVLYPDDHTLAGKELRLKQQYFFVSATIRDIIRRYRKYHPTYNEFPEKVAIQLNDTHPAIAVAELMRILVDEDSIAWNDAWDITKKTFAYTNHTVLPEAIETWSEGLMGNLLPRHLQIIQEIDRRFLIQVTERFSGEPQRKWQMAIITGDGEKRVHMARLALVGSHTINGVSRLHSDILKENVFKNFYLMFPERFQNVTNGVTPRRWLLEANPGLSSLITEAIGEGWEKNLDELRKLESLAEDTEFRKRFREIKMSNKIALSDFLKRKNNLSFQPSFLLDCQIKRFHEYKRQLLNILHAITLYNRIKDKKTDEAFVPRTILFAGKAAPGYFLCKLMIKLIHCISDAINAHPVVNKKLKVIFVPDYGVTLAQHIIPAAELSEQISTAGYEASGTSSMKFILNGALTIGTLDGANVEIREEVGEENFFLFGLKAHEIMEMHQTYNPRKYYEEDENLRQIINQLSKGYFSPMEPELFYPIVKSLLEGDRFFVLADYASYINCQENVTNVYRDEERWTKMAILNVARSGIFSSDRAIREYAEKIWKISPVPV
ncbi:MAG: glycogen phosphorylase [Nitrospirae bacterium CG_4_10_14_0_8_um_filter_41_23]|nr:glycogen/starch/alpha-glucan phosphorylase [Nitrospirota bacterium]OIP61586.1 MAG: glycogen phosphorylase [Nitrospirae bacterium CG2_30_41_42]PIQ93987.1 MAG: glycogen phosphorylase [Nitrospirae bacterium CG11_big_fil_rev_8_21_14_0_20_41_14]PIV42319.1 MAG: glycogen phosphorylase [Nitrospirae bacterium CG02_land_8_20_14_3_00_41_53]PIW86795.1 MAG: glycogen phosphorylase [Nitrospirae bacterium CG_4_8_14_3_um_filter_41_47]PIY87287.1 MAG: glycogen phosphorylase [Nitrospirae bacterium CG_4_10_14_0